jgi:hypothetical protein
MSEKLGWEFFVMHNGRVRRFMVGVAGNEDAAKLAVQTFGPTINFLNFVSKQHVTWDLIEFLKIEDGNLREWGSVDPDDPIVPRGIDINSPL